MFTETQNVKYSEEVHTIIFQGKPITLTERTPVFTPEQREKRKKEIEHKLYGIFKKYTEIPQKCA
jgi:hypothetical protein